MKRKRTSLFHFAMLFSSCIVSCVNPKTPNIAKINVDSISTDSNAVNKTLEQPKKEIIPIVTFEPDSIPKIKKAGISDTISLRITKNSSMDSIRLYFYPQIKDNIRINQLFFPDGEADGPFSQDMTYPIKMSGIYKVVVGESLMADGRYDGPYTLYYQGIKRKYILKSTKN